MRFSDLLLWALPAALVSAEVLDRRAHSPKACHGSVYKSLRAETDGKSFCSSFLRTTATRTTTLPVVTTTVRVTGGRATATVTSTSTKTSVVYSGSTPLVTSTITSYSSAAISCASSAGFLPGSIASGAGGNGAGKDLEKRTLTKSPYTTPPALSGQPSASISSLCSCLHVNVRTKTARTTVGKSTATVTKTIGQGGSTITKTAHTTVYNTVTRTTTAKTQTTTVTYVQTVPTTFNGLNWYAYPNSYDFSAGSPVIDVTLFNSPDYEDSGTVKNPTAVAPGNSVPTCTLPGSSNQLNCEQITVVMQAYLYAPADGSYTLTTGGSDASAVDNYVGLWTGNIAYNNYNDQNADWIAVREDHSTIQQGGSSTYTFSQGQLIPVTLIYMNGGYAGNFQFQVITPDGIVNSDTSNFWIPACPNNDLFSP